MGRSITSTEKRGRGRPRKDPTSIHLTLEPIPLAQVDRWSASQKDNPSRPEAIRRLLDLALAKTSTKRRAEPDSSHRAGMRAKKAADASQMASLELDRIGDPSATDEERQLRKRRLMKGPKEFRDIRNNARTKR
jgi:hypothetical protein